MRWLKQGMSGLCRRYKRLESVWRLLKAPLKTKRKNAKIAINPNTDKNNPSRTVGGNDKKMSPARTVLPAIPAPQHSGWWLLVKIVTAADAGICMVIWLDMLKQTDTNIINVTVTSINGAINFLTIVDNIQKTAIGQFYILYNNINIHPLKWQK